MLNKSPQLKNNQRSYSNVTILTISKWLHLKTCAACVTGGNLAEFGAYYLQTRMRGSSSPHIDSAGWYLVNACSHVIGLKG